MKTPMALVVSSAALLAACGGGGKAPCGQTPHGGQEQRSRYAAPEVPYGTQCAAEDQTRTCEDGRFTGWSGSYAYDACLVAAPSACGPGEPHGTEQTRSCFDAPTVPFGSSCTSAVQTRSCANGAWSEWPACANPSCSVEECARGAVETRSCYASATVPFGQSCSSAEQTRSCPAGTWGSFPACEHLTCVEVPCGNGAIDPPERCDGADLGTLTCADNGFDGAGTLACTATCDDHDFAGCGGCAALAGVPWVEELSTPGIGEALLVGNRLIYSRQGGPCVVDVTDPLALVELGCIPPGDGTLRSFAASDTHLYVVSDGATTLEIFAGLDPATTQRVGTLALSGTAPGGVYFEAPRLYLYMEGAGLAVIDVSNPAAPSVLASYAPPNGMVDFVVNNGRVFYTEGPFTKNVYIVELQTPTAPVSRGSISTTGFASGLHLFGNQLAVLDSLACVGCTTGALRVYGVGFLPPTSSGSYIGGNDPRFVDLLSGYAVVGTLEDGVVLLDRGSGTFTERATYPLSETVAFVAGGASHAFVGTSSSATGTSIRVIDLNRVYDDPLVETVTAPRRVADLAVIGDRLLAIEHTSDASTFALVSFLIAGDGSLTRTGEVTSTSKLRDLEPVGGLLYVLTNGALLVFDVSTAVPTLVKTVASTPEGYLGGWYGGMDSSGGVLVIADDSYDVQVVDVSDPANPALVGHLALSGTAVNVAVRGSYAYVSDDATIQVVDVSNPSSPAILRNLGAFSQVQELAVTWNTLYAMRNAFGAQVLAFDLANPAQPQALSGYRGGRVGSATDYLGLQPHGDYLLAGFRNTIELLDFSTRTGPRMVGAYEVPHSPSLDDMEAIAVKGRFAFMGTKQGSGGAYYVFEMCPP